MVAQFVWAAAHASSSPVLQPSFRVRSTRLSTSKRRGNEAFTETGSQSQSQSQAQSHARRSQLQLSKLERLRALRDTRTAEQAGAFPSVPKLPVLGVVALAGAALAGAAALLKKAFGSKRKTPIVLERLNMRFVCEFSRAPASGHHAKNAGRAAALLHHVRRQAGRYLVCTRL